MLALDARVLIYEKNVQKKDLPRLAIRPYPTEYVSSWQDSEGANLTFRPIRPEDEPLMVKFHETLSENSVYSRYFHQISLSQRVSHDRLAKICFVDYSREVVLVVEQRSPETGESEILAVGRLNKRGNPSEAEFAILVSDRFQGRGIGRHLLARLLDVAPKEGINHVVGYVLPENAGMLKACQNLGFRIVHDQENRVVEATVDLKTD
jgi:acetyltransferase